LVSIVRHQCVATGVFCPKNNHTFTGAAGIAYIHFKEFVHVLCLLWSVKLVKNPHVL